MNEELVKIRQTAMNFAHVHHVELAVEILEWQDKALLRNGKVRELAEILRSLDPHHSLKLAESFAARAIMEGVVLEAKISKMFG